MSKPQYRGHNGRTLLQAYTSCNYQRTRAESNGVKVMTDCMNAEGFMRRDFFETAPVSSTSETCSWHKRLNLETLSAKGKDYIKASCKEMQEFVPASL